MYIYIYIYADYEVLEVKEHTCKLVARAMSFDVLHSCRRQRFPVISPLCVLRVIRLSLVREKICRLKYGL